MPTLRDGRFRPACNSKSWQDKKPDTSQLRKRTALPLANVDPTVPPGAPSPALPGDRRARRSLIAVTLLSLGVALLLSGDAMSARAAYGKALDSDPTNEKARANLAALRCRFGDTEGARRELSVLKDSGALSGPDLDPEWKACR